MRPDTIDGEDKDQLTDAELDALQIKHQGEEIAKLREKLHMANTVLSSFGVTLKGYFS